MVTISVKALWIVAIGLTAFYFVLVNFPTEVGGLPSPPELPIYIGLAFLWIVVVFLTIVRTVGRFISQKRKNL